MKRGDLIRVTEIQPLELLEQYGPYAIVVDEPEPRQLRACFLRDTRQPHAWWIDACEDASDDPEALRQLALWALDGHVLPEGDQA